MAVHELQGQDWVLLIDAAGGTAATQIVCLKSITFNSERGEIDGSSFCGPSLLPGLANESIDYDAFASYDAGASKASAAIIYGLIQTKARISWSITRVTPVTGDPVKTGFGYILSHNESYSLNELTGFTGKIKIDGDVTQVITV